jgi:predicted CoA-binding protein
MAVPDERLRDILTRARVIAVVGLSDKPERDSNEVARYLKQQGYEVIPVNPTRSAVLGERSYPSISAIPPETRIDIVDIFRRSSEVVPIVEEAGARKVPTIWMQLGVQNAQAAQSANGYGATVLENSCIMQVHKRLRIPPIS